MINTLKPTLLPHTSNNNSIFNTALQQKTLSTQLKRSISHPQLNPAALYQSRRINTDTQNAEMALLQKSFHDALGGLFDEVNAPYHMLNDNPARLFPLSFAETLGRVRNNDEAISYAKAYITKIKASSGNQADARAIARFEKTVNEWVGLQKERTRIALLKKDR